jgi:hypothetical protein
MEEITNMLVQLDVSTRDEIEDNVADHVCLSCAQVCETRTALKKHVKKNNHKFGQKNFRTQRSNFNVRVDVPADSALKASSDDYAPPLREREEGAALHHEYLKLKVTAVCMEFLGGPLQQ